MSNLNENKITEALKQVVDPEYDKDIVALGYVKNTAVMEKKVSIDIEIPNSTNSKNQFIQKTVEDALINQEGVSTVKVNVSMPQPAQHAQASATPDTLKDIKHIIAISSCKGGVGKSTISTHIAYQLAQQGYKVGLIDADIHGPSIPSLLNLNNPDVFANELNQLKPIEKDNLKVMSFGFLLGDGPAVMRGPVVSRYIQEILFNTLWGELDYLFIDFPPGTGDIQLTITQSARLDGAIIVTTPQTLSLVDVARGIIMFEKVSVPIIGVIENMSYYQCDECGKQHRIFGEIDQDYFENRFGIAKIAELPISPDLAVNITSPNISPESQHMLAQVVKTCEEKKKTQQSIPTVQFDKESIRLQWPDGSKENLSNKDVRLSCQCALCINEITGEKLFNEEQLKSDIAPTAITPLGNYALSITWNDGHASGIYPYTRLKELAKNHS